MGRFKNHRFKNKTKIAIIYILLKKLKKTKKKTKNYYCIQQYMYFLVLASSLYLYKMSWANIFSSAIVPRYLIHNRDSYKYPTVKRINFNFLGKPFVVYFNRLGSVRACTRKMRRLERHQLNNPNIKAYQYTCIYTLLNLNSHMTALPSVAQNTFVVDYSKSWCLPNNGALSNVQIISHYI